MLRDRPKAGTHLPMLHQGAQPTLQTSILQTVIQGGLWHVHHSLSQLVTMPEPAFWLLMVIGLKFTTRDQPQSGSRPTSNSPKWTRSVEKNMTILPKPVSPWALGESARKAEILAKDMGLDYVPVDMLELIYHNLNYAGNGGFNPALYKRFQQVKRVLKELAEQAIPKHGHLVKLMHSTWGSYDEAALLLSEADRRWGGHRVACHYGKVIAELELQDYGLDMYAGSGGPIEKVTDDQVQSLIEFDLYPTHYQFWGATPCGNGMITVYVPMKRWYLTM